MTTTLVSAAARSTTAPQATRRIPLAARAAAQHAAPSAALARVATVADNVPSASAFQSAL